MSPPLLPELGLPPGARIGVALSGGSDSTALLFLLCEEPRTYDLAILHINHGWRGAESDGDEEFCRQLATRFELPFHLRRITPTEEEGNREEAARDARLQYFTELLESQRVDYVVTAHTRNDQAETVLFRLLRGAHLAGLAGIQPRSGRILRPLLHATRSELREYLEAKGELWREDSSNSLLQFDRNRIRHDLLPQLERDWNPELTKALAQTATLAQDEEEFWKSYTAQSAQRIFSQKGNTWIADASNLVNQPVALQRRLVRWAVQQVKGNLKQIGFQHIEAVVKLAGSLEGHGRIILPGVDVLRSFEWMRFAPYDWSERGKQDRLAERNWSQELAVPGEAAAPDGSLIRLEVVGPGENDTVRASDELVCGVEGPPPMVTLRSWKPGDEYRPAGSDGPPRKLKTMFQDHRIPLWDRGTWPIIAIGRQIIWARQFGPAHSLRDTGTRAARLRITRIG